MLTLDEEKLKVLLLNRKSHLERSKLDGVSEIISSISLIVTLALGDFSVISFMDPSLFQLVAWVIAFAILLLGAIQLIRNNWRRFSVENLYNEIADLDPCTEHGFCIAIIRNPNRGGNYLLFYSKRWRCWLFPNYSCEPCIIDPEKRKENFEKKVKRDFGISEGFSVKYIGDKLSNKFSYGDKVEKKYHFFFYEVSGGFQLKRKMLSRLSQSGKKCCWKTTDQMYSSRAIRKKNSDVIDFVRKKCEIN